MYTNIFFVEKNMRSFRTAKAVQKLLSFFNKNISVFSDKVVKHLTS